MTGQEGFAALGPSSVSRTPPEGASKAASKGTERRARASPEPVKDVQAQSSAQQAAPKRPIERSGTRVRIDDATDRLVAQILGSNNEVIKQIPPDEMLKIVANVRRLQGLLFDQEA
ncbi:MAG: flagellar protein FlaG [Candidatus Hydrogenedentes bacterium]|nr:flagellar protein FlaG [Candidatus Hydrogenedentota bacterium]